MKGRVAVWEVGGHRSSSEQCSAPSAHLCAAQRARHPEEHLLPPVALLLFLRAAPSPSSSSSTATATAAAAARPLHVGRQGVHSVHPLRGHGVDALCSAESAAAHTEQQGSRSQPAGQQHRGQSTQQHTHSKHTNKAGTVSTVGAEQSQAAPAPPAGPTPAALLPGCPLSQSVRAQRGCDHRYIRTAAQVPALAGAGSNSHGVAARAGRQAPRL